MDIYHALRPTIQWTRVGTSQESISNSVSSSARPCRLHRARLAHATKIQGPSVLKPTTYYYPTAIQMGHRHSYNQLIVDARPAQMVSSLTYRVSTSNITYKQSSYYGQSWKPPQVPPGANKPRFSRQRPTIRTKHASGSPVSQYNPSTFQLHQAGQMYQEQLHSSSFTNAKHFQQPSADILRKKATPFHEGPPLSGIPDHDISPLLIGVNRVRPFLKHFTNVISPTKCR